MCLNRRVLMLVVIVAAHCQSPFFFPSSQQDVFGAVGGGRRGLFSARTAPSMLPGVVGYSSIPASFGRPFSAFGRGLSSPSTLNLLDKSDFVNNAVGGAGDRGGGGRVVTGGQRQRDPFSRAGVSRGDTRDRLARNHPFSSIRLNPVPTSRGVSLSRPREGASGRFGKDRFSSLFDSDNAHKYSLDSPSTFEKPITKTSLPDVNSPIQLDLASDEQERVAYAKRQGKLPPSRGTGVEDRERPKLHSFFSSPGARLTPNKASQALSDWERPSSLPPMPGHASPTTTNFNNRPKPSSSDYPPEPSAIKKDLEPFATTPIEPARSGLRVDEEGRKVGDRGSMSDKVSAPSFDGGNHPGSGSETSPTRLPIHEKKESDTPSAEKDGVRSLDGAEHSPVGDGDKQPAVETDAGLSGPYTANTTRDAHSSGSTSDRSSLLSAASDRDDSPAGSVSTVSTGSSSVDSAPLSGATSSSDPSDAQIFAEAKKKYTSETSPSGSSKLHSPGSAELSSRGNTADSDLTHEENVMAKVDRQVNTLKTETQGEGTNLLELSARLDPLSNLPVLAGPTIPLGTDNVLDKTDVGRLVSGTSASLSPNPTTSLDDSGKDVKFADILSGVREAAGVRNIPQDTSSSSSSRDNTPFKDIISKTPASNVHESYPDMPSYGDDLDAYVTTTPVTPTTQEKDVSGSSGLAGGGLSGSLSSEYAEDDVVDLHERAESVEKDSIPPDRHTTPFETNHMDGNYSTPSQLGNTSDFHGSSVQAAPPQHDQDTSQDDLATLQGGDTSPNDRTTSPKGNFGDAAGEASLTPADTDRKDPSPAAGKKSTPPRDEQPSQRSHFWSALDRDNLVSQDRQNSGDGRETSHSDSQPFQSGMELSPPTERTPPRPQDLAPTIARDVFKKGQDPSISDLVSFEEEEPAKTTTRQRTKTTVTSTTVLEDEVKSEPREDDLGSSTTQQPPPAVPAPAPAPSPFQVMFGKTLQDAYHQTFGSLFGNLNKGPPSSAQSPGSLFGGLGMLSGGAGGFSSPTSAINNGLSFNGAGQGGGGHGGDGEQREGGGRGGFGGSSVGLRGGNSVGFGGGSGGFGGNVFGGKAQLFDANVNGIVNKRPSLKLFGGRK